MRIAILAAGNTIHTVRWVNALSEKGHNVHLISLHKIDDTIVSRVHMHKLPVKGKVGYWLNGASLRRILGRVKPDLLNVHYASGYGTLGRLGAFHPTILSVWGSDVYDFPLKSPLHRFLLVRNLRYADHICSTSKVMAEQTRRIDSRIESITVTPFGVDTGAFAPRQDGRDTECLTIGTVKSLAHKYGVDILIRAFDRVYRSILKEDSGKAGRLRLLIVGGGPDRGKLEQLASDLGISGICEFTGQVAHSEVPQYLNRLDIYVAASRLESFGAAVLEASACGVPVVVANVGGLPEIVVDGDTGIIAEKDSPEAMAGALSRLIEDDALRVKMGSTGRRHVMENYEWKNSVEIMEGVFRKALRDSGIACSKTETRKQK